MEPIARRETGTTVARVVGALAIAAGLALLAALAKTMLSPASRPDAPPEPVVVEPEPVAVVVEPQPEPVAVEPEPEPVAVEPEPEPFAIEPIAVEPEAVEPEPAAPYVWTRPGASLPLHHWNPREAA